MQYIYVHSPVHMAMALRKPRDRMRLNSSTPLDSVKGNLECIHWIYV